MKSPIHYWADILQTFIDSLEGQLKNRLAEIICYDFISVSAPLQSPPPLQATPQPPPHSTLPAHPTTLPTTRPSLTADPCPLGLCLPCWYQGYLISHDIYFCPQHSPSIPYPLQPTIYLAHVTIQRSELSFYLLLCQRRYLLLLLIAYNLSPVILVLLPHVPVALPTGIQWLLSSRTVCTHIRLQAVETG